MATEKKESQRRPSGAPANKESNPQKETYEWIQSLITALMIIVLVFLFVVRVIDVSGSSMNPNLWNGDKMLVSGLFYTPKAGDIVIFKKPSYSTEKALVKRVIATEGQTVNIDFEQGIVYIDGKPIEEDYIAELTRTKEDFIGPKTVPEGCVFVMGDNRNASTDSRDSRIGMVDTRYIVGKAMMVIYPLNTIRIIN